MNDQLFKLVELCGQKIAPVTQLVSLDPYFLGESSV